MRVPKLTEWMTYVSHLEMSLENFHYQIRNSDDLDRAADELTKLIISAYEVSCPLKTRRTKRTVPWWNNQLGKMRKLVRKLANKAKATSCPVGKAQFKAEHKTALTEYNKQIRRAKRKSWRSFCEEINDLPTASRVRKILSKDHTNGIGSLKRPDGTFTADGRETVDFLLNTHFPGCRVAENDAETDQTVSVPLDCNGDAWKKSSKIFSNPKIEWSIGKFKPFKSAGPDGLFPALLQKGLDLLTPHLRYLFRCSYCLGHVPKPWRGVKITFIPKAGRKDTENPKSFRPISLMSFLLKGMERLIELHARLEYLSAKPLNPRQFAYQAGKSTETSIHRLIRLIESTIHKKSKTKWMALAAFMDVEGAFDNTAFDSIRRAVEKRGFDRETTDWIMAMLRERNISASIGGDSMTVRATRGCPQGGVLSPLLWSLVMDGLIETLESLGFEVIAYADDIVVVVRGMDDSTISDRMQQALSATWYWCQNENLRINPEKTVLIPFTKRKSNNLRNPHLDGVSINFSSETKYLGVILDSKLTWRPHLNKVKTKTINCLMACRSLLGQHWGLNPKMMLWLYRTVIRPMVTYASLVWWDRAETSRMELRKVQRLACVMVTGAMRSTPTVALDALLNLAPLHVEVKKEAVLSAFRVLNLYKYLPGDFTGHLKVLNSFSELVNLNKIDDCMPITYNFGLPFLIRIPDRREWADGLELGESVVSFYTDGSKMSKGTGMGIYGPSLRTYEALGTTASIFQAELFAIESCARHCLSNDNLTGRNIFILSDSQAAIRALNSTVIRSKLVFGCLNILKLLASKCNLTLIWVPGHQGHSGNEIADELAREGSQGPFIGPEPRFGFGPSNYKEYINGWVSREKNKHFRTLPVNSMSRDFIRYDDRRTRQLMNLNRNEVRIVTGLLTGHCRLKSHLYNMKLSNDASCRKCLDERETARHILC